MTATVASAEARRSGRFVAGDPLRGLAALMVVIVHAEYEFAFVSPGLTGIFGDLGERSLTALAVCVYVFFVLSGYLIARPFVRAYVEGRSMPRVRPYLVNRALRIVPAYWVVLTAMLLIYGTLGSSLLGVAGTYGLLQQLFFIPARGVLLQSWTVSVEIFFYVTVPLAAFALAWATRGLGRRGRLRAVALTLLAVWVASILFRHLVPPSVGPLHKLQLSTPAFMWSFIPGIALAVLEVGGAPEAVRRTGARLLPGALLVVSALALVAIVALGSHPALQRTAGVAILASLMAGSLVAAPMVQQWAGRDCWRWLDNRALRWVGVRSYSLYLIHLAVLHGLRTPALELASPLGAFFLILLVGLPAALVLAHLSYELIERPMLRRKLPWRRGGAATNAARAGGGRGGAGHAYQEP